MGSSRTRGAATTRVPARRRGCRTRPTACSSSRSATRSTRASSSSSPPATAPSAMEAQVPGVIAAGGVYSDAGRCSCRRRRTPAATRARGTTFGPGTPAAVPDRVAGSSGLPPRGVVSHAAGPARSPDRPASAPSRAATTRPTARARTTAGRCSPAPPPPRRRSRAPPPCCARSTRRDPGRRSRTSCARRRRTSAPAAATRASTTRPRGLDLATGHGLINVAAAVAALGPRAAPGPARRPPASPARSRTRSPSATSCEKLPEPARERRRVPRRRSKKDAEAALKKFLELKDVELDGADRGSRRSASAPAALRDYRGRRAVRRSTRPCA